MTTTTFTEFCCRSGGNNLCSGSLTGQSTEEPVAPHVNYTAGTIGGVAGLGAGTWTASTNTFLPPSGRNPATDGLAAGQFISLYSGTPTATGYIARISSVANSTNGAVVLTTIPVAGSKPAGTGAAMNLVAGGAWLGPNTTDQSFPLAVALLASLTNVAANPTRINFKNDQTYSVTAVTTCALTNVQLNLQGYTTAYGDNGRAIIDGGTSGASYILWSFTGTTTDPYISDFTFQNNGSTGSAALINCAGRAVFSNIVFHDSAGPAITVGAVSVTFVECEAYLCNKNNTASIGAFQLGTGCNFVRCAVHDNAGANTRGIFHATTAGILVVIDSIFDTNGLHGIESNVAGVQYLIVGCDFYNNGGSGFYISAVINYHAFLENCNFVLNAGFGIRFTSGGAKLGLIRNCGFGSGTQVNGSGDIDRTDIGSILEYGTVTYASGVTPWTDPANGDFRINLAAAKQAGRGNFTETQASYAGTIGYPDIGAARHQDPSGASRARAFAGM